MVCSWYMEVFWHNTKEHRHFGFQGASHYAGSRQGMSGSTHGCYNVHTFVCCIMWLNLLQNVVELTTTVLRTVLGKTIVMVLLRHSSACGCFVRFA